MSFQKTHANEQLSSMGSVGISEPNIKRKRGDSTNCHQCHRKDKEGVIRCTKCKKNYCTPCITKWYPKMEVKSVAEACPKCRNICNCAACLQSDKAKKDVPVQEVKLSTEEKIQFFRYIVGILVPFLKKFVFEQNIVIAEEAKIHELLRKAEALAEVDKHALPLEVSQQACSCLRSNQESSSNYLDCPIVADVGKSGIKHFQRHLKEGEPVIVPGVLNGNSGLSWEPAVLLRICRKARTINLRDHFTVKNCLNWCEEKMEMHKFFQGYADGLFDSKGRHQILRLEDWPPSESFEERLPRHSAEFFRCLPFKQYTHPHAEMSVEVPKLSLKADFGPKMCISYGVPLELGCYSVSKLQYALSDRVNILMHTAEVSFDHERLPKIEKSRWTRISQDPVHSIINEGTNEEAEKDQRRFEDPDGGAVWDVFRRQDIHKLEEYLRRHSGDFSDVSSQRVVPIHEKIFYLTVEHKRKLKQEYGIIPWTFVQRLGDAVFIPAGCIHQIRNFKSCTSVAASFVSPESVGECVGLAANHRSILLDTKLMGDKLEMMNLGVESIRQAVEHFDLVTPNTTSVSLTSTPPPVAPAAGGDENEANPDPPFMIKECERMSWMMEQYFHLLEPAIGTSSTGLSTPQPATPTADGNQNGAYRPTLRFMREDCERILYMLELHGHLLPPRLRTKLICNIKNSLDKISRAIEGSSSS